MIDGYRLRMEISLSSNILITVSTCLANIFKIINFKIEFTEKKKKKEKETIISQTYPTPTPGRQRQQCASCYRAINNAHSKLLPI